MKGVLMATRYDSYSVFLVDVVSRTKERFHTVPFSAAWGICVSILKTGGWVALVAICAILILGPLGFSVALVPFMASPVGILLVAGGGGAALWILYRNKKLPLAIKKIGDRHKARYEGAHGDHGRIDSQLEDAARDLFNELLS